MGYIYTDTLSPAGKSELLRRARALYRLSRDLGFLFPPERPPIAGFLEYQPFRQSFIYSDRIHRALSRRLDASIERRRAAALSEGSPEDEAIWRAEVRREGNLTAALLAWDSRPF